MKITNDDDPQITALRALVAGHRTDRTGRSRVGAIIERFRPAPALAGDMLPDGPPPEGMSPAHHSLLVRRVAETAPSVGVIEVEEDGWHAVGTCFRVSSDPRRVATARHLLRALLPPGVSLLCAPDEAPRAIPPTPPYRRARVRFDESPAHTGADGHARPARAAQTIALDAIEWAHDHWDVMLLRLAEDCARPALALATAADLAAPDSAICVIGYPLLAPAEEASHSFAELFDGPLGVKRASPGRLRDAAGADAGVLRHDASTLGGSSGSPIVSLATGEIVGLHHFGGAGRDDPNRAVSLPVALDEPALADRMAGDGTGPWQPATWPGGPRRRFGLALAALRSDGEEYAATASPELPDAVGVVADRFDSRDRTYLPPLVPARGRILPERPEPDSIARQTDPFSCTGFALAAAIDRQLRDRTGRGPAPRVSPAMLYAMATEHDEFVDDRPGGSSLRGAIKGFFHSGACTFDAAPYQGHDPGWHMTVRAAKEAREVSLGAYYRLRPVLADYQLAVQEAGAVLVSAHTHSGWARGARPVQRLPFRPGRAGAHAFVIVGYDERGFVIRNSWGPDWGTWKDRPGHAHWSYADWAENLIDGWVIRLAPRAPEAFGLQVKLRPDQAQPSDMPPAIARLRDPRRVALIGNVLHAERDGLRSRGRLGIGPSSVRETALYLDSETGRRKYPALALIFHDPTFPGDWTARLVGNMIAPFKANGIYPVHVIYGADEMRSLVVRMQDEAQRATARAAASGERLTAWLGRRAGDVARPLWESWSAGIGTAMAQGGGLWQGLASIGLEAGRVAAGEAPRQLHIVALGAGWGPAAAALEALGELGFPAADSVGRVAPVSGRISGRISGRAAAAAVGGDAHKGLRLRSWQLGAGRPADLALPGYDGDWCDLLAGLSPVPGPAPRAGEGAGAGPDLATACTATDTLNGLLRHMLGRTPAPSRRFF